MKLKAVVSPGLPKRLVEALIHPDLNTWYLNKIVAGCLHVDLAQANPATHYIQYPDFSVGWTDGQCGVEVSFSKLSASFSRSGADFHRARLLIQDKFAAIINQNLPVGRSCSLFVGSQTDRPVEGPNGAASTLVELPDVLVQGGAQPDAEGDVPAGDFSLKPLGR